MISPQPRHALGTTSLSLGAHLCPDDGACLMEAVSAHAGEQWSDAPRCTHPLVAHAARLVNDASSDTARQVLLSMVPILAGAQSDDAAAYPRVALACTSLGLRQHQSLLLNHLHNVAVAQLRREATADRLSGKSISLTRRRLFQRGPAHRAVEAAVVAITSLPEPERDAVLLEMLNAAVASVAGTGSATDAVGCEDAVGFGRSDDAQRPRRRCLPSVLRLSSIGQCRAQETWRCARTSSG